MRFAWICLVVLASACGDASQKDDPVVINNVANNVANNAANNVANNVANNANNSGNNVANNAGNNADLGRVSVLEPGFDSPAVAFGPGGVSHIAYTAGALPGKLVYGTCSTGCQSDSNWQLTTLSGADLVGESRLGVDASGRVHLVWEQQPMGGATQTLYGTCASGCLDVGNWQTVDLTGILGGTVAAYRGAPMLVDGAGAVAFVNSSLTFNATVRLTICAGECTNPNNWVSGTVRQGGNRAALAIDESGLHMMLNNEGGAIVYRHCAQDCINAESWQETTLFAHDSNSNIAFASSDGTLRVAYNQGLANEGESEAVKAQNRRMMYWECSSGCLEASNWRGTPIGATNDGESISMVAVGPVSVLAMETDSLELQVGVCESGCTDAANWGVVGIDSSEVMNAEIDPKPLVCDGTPYFASWYVNDPVLAISLDTGAGLVGHSASILTQCSIGQQMSSTYAMGRFIYLP